MLQLESPLLKPKVVKFSSRPTSPQYLSNLPAAGFHSPVRPVSPHLFKVGNGEVQQNRLRSIDQYLYQKKSPEEHKFSCEIDQILNNVCNSKQHLSNSKVRQVRSNDQSVKTFPSAKRQSASPVRAVGINGINFDLNQTFQQSDKEKIPQNIQKQQLKRFKCKNERRDLSSQSNTRAQPELSLRVLMYILGDQSKELLQIIEGKQQRQKDEDRLMERMRFKEFTQFQQQRMSLIWQLYNKFFIEVLIKESKSREIFEEIAEEIKQELAAVISFYHKYGSAMEKMYLNLHGEKEDDLIIIPNFQQAILLLTEIYNSFSNDEDDAKIKVKQEGGEGEINVLSGSILHYKISLKQDQKNQKAFRLFTILEKLLKNNYERIQTQAVQIEKLKEENNTLTQMCIELQKAKSEFSHTLLSLQNQKDANSSQKQPEIKQETNAAPFLKSFPAPRHLENYYNETISKLQAENKVLNEQIQKQNRRIYIYNNFNTMLKDKNEVAQSKLMEDSKRFKTQNQLDKNIQCNLVYDKIMVSQQQQDNQVSSILDNPLLYLQSATVYPKEWVSMVIHSIMSDKLISDILDEHDSRPAASFMDYICEWFLKKFGNKDIGETLLKDFLISLKKCQQMNDRFHLFCEITQIHELLEKEDPCTGEQSLSFSPSSQALSNGKEVLEILQKVGYLVKMTQKNYFGTSSNLPLLPNILSKCLDLIPIDQALRIWETIAQEENVSKLDISTLESKFKKICVSDVEKRSKDPLCLYIGLVEEQDMDYIRFDTLCRYIVETMIDQRYLEIDNIYSSLKLKVSPKAEGIIDFMEYSKIMTKIYPKRSVRWIEITYRELCKGILSDKTPLWNAVLKLTPFLTNQDSIKENFLHIKNLKEEIPEDQAENSSLQNTNNNNNLQSTPLNHQLSSNKINRANVSSKKKSTFISPESHSVEVQKGKDKIVQLFDSVSQLGLLEESYKILFPLIKLIEKKQPNISSIHSSLKEDFSELPQQVIKLVRYDSFDEHPKEQIIKLIESAWEKFRKILSVNLKN